MLVKNIALQNFRNYESLLLDLDNDVTIIYGRNGQGKTNLLEGVFLCAAGRSHRTGKDKEMLRFGEQEGHVALRIERKDGEREIDITVPAQGRKRIMLNGVTAVRVGELMGHFNVVLFSPEDLQLVKDGPERRRRFMDMEMSQVKKTYFYELQQYVKILAQRNALLKSLYGKPGLLPTLDVWDEQLVRSAARIGKARATFLERLQREAGSLHRQISGGETLTLTYVPSLSPEMTEDAMLSCLYQAHEDDIRSGVTSLGPHRDDITVMVQGRSARSYASQGQQRTAALAMKLSELVLMQSDTGEMPVLLLDDVMSELDDKRQSALLEYTRGTQLLLTCAADAGRPWWERGARKVRIETNDAGIATCIQEEERGIIHESFDD